MEQTTLIFKAGTPSKVLAEIRRTYAEYLVDAGPAGATPGERARTLRDGARLTLREVGERLGCAAQRVHDLESGFRPIGKKTAQKLAEVYNVSPLVFY